MTLGLLEYTRLGDPVLPLADQGLINRVSCLEPWLLRSVKYVETLVSKMKLLKGFP